MDINTLISSNENLIYKIATRFSGIETEDLYQVGVIGLLKAFNNFNQDGNTKFSTYAYDYIFGEMYKLATENRAIKLSKDVLRLYKKIEQSRYYLAQKVGYMPSNNEIALFLEIDEDLIEKTINSAKTVMSLDNTQEDDSLYDVIPAKEEVSLNDKIAIDDSFKVLNDDEKQIINYRYFQDFTQSETAKAMGMTQVMVSRYEKKSIEKMREYLMA